VAVPALRIAAVVLLASLLPAAFAGADGFDGALRALELIPLPATAAPAFSLEALADGARVTLAEVRGRPALLYFFATW
jgi:cytochrome oxidase Cu insertion factor (SCO1/SenC/PrrC family)